MNNRITLKDVCTDFLVPMRARPKEFNGDIPWCRIEDIEGRFFNKSLNGLGVDAKTVEAMNLTVFPKNTVICSCSATLGAYAINTVPLVTNQTFIGLVCDKTKVDYRYLYYRMKLMTPTLKNRAIGSTIPYIPRETFENLEIDIPDLEKQQKIATVLWNIDSKIENNNKVISELKSMTKTIYDYWFLQFEFPNEEGKPYKSSGGKMVWNDALKREIPEGWKASPYATFGNLLMGQSPKSDSYNNAGVGYPLINGAAELQKDNVIISKYTSNPTRISGKGDLLFCIRATIGNLQFGQTEYCLGRGVASYSPIDKRYAEYLYFVTNDILEHYNKILTGSIIVGITKEDLSEQAVLAPSKERVFAFSKVTQPMFDKIYELKAENQKLTSLRDFLLPMLMNGQVTFKEEA